MAARVQDINFCACPYIECVGKGRKHRPTPVEPALAKQIKAWIVDNHLADTDPVFPAVRSGHLTRNGLWRLVAKHARTATVRPEKAGAQVTPHVLWHSAAMRMLHNGVDFATITLRLGHEHIDTTLIYLHADLERKQQALDQTAPPGVPPGRYAPTPDTLSFLTSLGSG